VTFEAGALHVSSEARKLGASRRSTSPPATAPGQLPRGASKGIGPAPPPFVPELPRFTFEFRGQPGSKGLEWVAEKTGLPMVGNVKPTGTFTFVSPVAGDGRVRQYTLAEIIDILNDALIEQHFLLMRRSNNFVIVPTDKKIDYSLFMNVPS